MANYATKEYNTENMARAILISAQISTKQSVEVCNALRGKNLEDAKKFLEDVKKKEEEVPFKRYNMNIAHKKAGPGRYPVKVSKNIIDLLNQVTANAQFKGMNTSNLMICHICANKGSRPWKFGRQRRRKTKRTHIEIIVREASPKNSKEKKNDKKKK